MIGKLLSGAAATVLAALDSPASGSDIVLGKEAYNSNGDKIMGTLESINNPWKPSSQSEYDTIVESKNKVGNYIEYSGKTTKVMPEVLSGTFAVGDVVETVYFDTTKSPYLSVTSWDVENVNMGNSTYVRIKYLMVGDETVTISGTAVKKGLVYISDEANSNNYLIYDTTKSLPLYVGGTGWGITQGWLLDSTTFEAAITLTTVDSDSFVIWNGKWAFKARTPQYAKEYYANPTLANEGTASDLAKGKQLINSRGAIVMGTAIIGENKFAQLVEKTIKTVTVGDLEGVTNIRFSTFNSCTNLSDVFLPDSIVELGSQAFDGCSNLKNISLSDNLQKIGYAGFRNCIYLEDISLPNKMATLDERVFEGCIRLANIILPNNITSIGKYAFKGCNSFTNIEFPTGITSISEGVCYGCRRLSAVTLPDSATSIETYAFRECPNLIDIIIPQNITSIGTYSFDSCSGLKNITLIPTTPPSLGYNAFRYCNSLTTITVPAGTGDAYKAATNWSSYASKIVEAEA